MTTQIVKLNKKSAQIKLRSGKITKIKIDSFYSFKNDLIGMLNSVADIKEAIDFYADQFSREKFWGKLLEAHIPTKEQKAARRRYTNQVMKESRSKRTAKIAQFEASDPMNQYKENLWESLA